MKLCRSQQPRGLGRRSAADRLLELWVRIPPGAWMSVCCECCVLSDRGLCDEVITRPDEFYWLRCVIGCDLQTSWIRRPWPTGGLPRQIKYLKYNEIVKVSEPCNYAWLVIPRFNIKLTMTECLDSSFNMMTRLVAGQSRSWNSLSSRGTLVSTKIHRPETF